MHTHAHFATHTHTTPSTHTPTLPPPTHKEDRAEILSFYFPNDIASVASRGSSVSQVTVNITDANDNAPRVTPINMPVTLPEDAPVGRDVAQFVAYDDDELAQNKRFE